MVRKRVTSSNIAAIGYDPETETLEVEFLNSSVYEYLNVPENIYNNLMAASSHGAYLNREIRDRYSFRQIR